MMDGSLLPRLVQESLEEYLGIMPAVVVTGARQTGKSTLAAELTTTPRLFLSLDDFDLLDQARRDPDSLIGGTQPVTLDEIQREPRLLHAVKRAIDRRRRPGQFLLTGSANLLLMRRVSESLAGRAGYLTLRPMTVGELRGAGCAGIWDGLINARVEDWLEVVTAQPRDYVDWRRMVRSGGFPFPALHLTSDRERSVWFDGYIRTYLERDLQALSSIAALPDFRRLMRATALRIGGLVNQTKLGRDVALPQSTVHRYLNLLETSYLLVRLPAYAVNRTKRLIKSPKLYWGDTGVAMHLTQETAPGGAHLENLILNDLLAWRDARLARAEILYWRTTAGEEVDFVVEVGDKLLPIEVKSTSRPRFRDIRNLLRFQSEYADQVEGGLLLHTGDTVEWLAPGVLAAPWWQVL